ncbi:hypothetical protein C8J57DRAFT_1520384 [Mycena rebaudengoi]|nr:hypothetical protein C8J57DRAFT_1520384 [Mycena rebaudengoi]
MFFNKSLLAAISTAMLVGAANAFTGTATRGALISPVIRCCADTVIVTYNGKSVGAILSAVYDAGAGTENIALSDIAFDMIEDTVGQTTLSPVTWSFRP